MTRILSAYESAPSAFFPQGICQSQATHDMTAANLQGGIAPEQDIQVAITNCHFVFSNNHQAT
jgi:hypothetical protein